MYVLSADGSKLYLLDPSTPERHEDPPAYSSISSPRSVRSSVPVSPLPASEEIGVEDRLDPASPRSVRVYSLPSTRSSVSLGSGRDRSREGQRGGRDRAYTTTAASSPGFGRIYTAEGPLDGERVVDEYRDIDGEAGEETPLLGLCTDAARTRRGTIRSIFCGEVEDGDDGLNWKDGWRRFWNPVNKGLYWRSVLHLLILNFPFVSLTHLIHWPQYHVARSQADK